MSKRLDNESFIRRAKDVHGDIYDYSEVKYKNIDTPVNIKCTIHGEFKKSPYVHLKGGGCQKCAFMNRSAKLTSNTNTFIQKCINLYGDKYLYDNVLYVKSNSHVNITCKEHGDFPVTPGNFLKGTECPKCKYDKMAILFKKDLSLLLEDASKIHDNKYDYSYIENNNYKNVASYINIICPIHGIFTQRLNNHIYRKTGCPICSKEQLAVNNTFSKSFWKSLNPETDKTLYLIDCFDDNEQFIKIGITSQKISERFKSSWELPYKYEILDRIVSKNGSFIWETELYLKRLFKKYKYLPQHDFGGRYECFNKKYKNTYINEFNDLKEKYNAVK